MKLIKIYFGNLYLLPLMICLGSMLHHHYTRKIYFSLFQGLWNGYVFFWLNYCLLQDLGLDLQEEMCAPRSESLLYLSVRVLDMNFDNMSSWFQLVRSDSICQMAVLSVDFEQLIWYRQEVEHKKEYSWRGSLQYHFQVW